VEDSEDVLELARGHLGRLGYTVVVARSGEEALATYEAVGGRVDLLFTDIVMPGGINGLMLAERLRARRPGLPVLLTTGYNDELVADGPRAHGMSGGCSGRCRRRGRRSTPGLADPGRPSFGSASANWPKPECGTANGGSTCSCGGRAGW